MASAQEARGEGARPSEGVDLGGEGGGEARGEGGVAGREGS